MNILHTFYKLLHSIAPNIADSLRLLLKHQRKPWMLTQEEANQYSCFSDLPRKKIKTIQSELNFLCRKGNGSWSYSSTINHYFMLGLDCINSNLNDFMFQEKYDKLRNAKQPAFAKMLEHKYYTAAYLKSQGINISLPLGEINKKGEIFYKGEWKPLKSVLEEDNKVHYFAKLKDGMQGLGHIIVEYRDGTLYKDNQVWKDHEAYSELDNHTIEPFIVQHKELNRIYNQAVSNVRLVTLNHHGQIILYAQAILIGSRGAHVSNIRFGGIVVGVDSNGILQERGIYKSSDGFKSCKQHLDSGIVFKGFQIPMWQEAVDLALKAHASLRDIHSIGWDIAITSQGPIIIEANEEWGTMTQCFGGHHHMHLIKKYFYDVL